ncbi:penicillin-binding protein 1A [Peribacillus loiseleuriae]|uniref:Penicillin-binding protein n=1 Tax=Peribacillus loiseleuriae TaxID=1679170 RepID=A0A0K9GV58_9BACI|nr:penicillin-binding protein 1A [Peribacillus loiseleuriae]KMY50574.1 penicillin-binding protein [Peribacillus loiseleuriae]
MAEKYHTREERRNQANSNKQRKAKKKKPKGLFKKIFLVLVTLGIIGLVAGGATLAYFISDAPTIDESLLKDPLSSKILDKDGKLLTEEGVEKREYVAYADIPEVVKNAVLATEDVRFFKHGGVDLLRLGSAVIGNVTNGFGSQGASTLTQQVVKRTFLTTDKTLKRKVQEAWLAIKLEQRYTKEEIFEMYVNKIWYANYAFGIATAADTYYGKELKDLKLEEVAMLVGLPQSPSRYNPYKYPERAQERRNVVLHLMNRHGFITEEEMKKAQSIPVTQTLKSEDTSKIDTKPYDAFIDQVIEEVQKMGDYNPYTDGLEIYTTIDKDAQKYVYDMLNTEDIIQYPSKSLQAGISLIDTKTGEIRAIGGGRNIQGKRVFNYATEAKRSPGSTIKPIMDYAPAIDKLNWSTYHQLTDEAYQYSNGTPIKNAGGRYRGDVSMREALERSLNIPALKALQAVGVDEGYAFAQELGIPIPKDNFESGAIGGTQSVSSMQIAGAYSAFGNGGIYNEPHTVTKIVLRDKTTIENKFTSKAAMKESTAFMISDMLKGVIDESYGTGRLAKVSGLPMAGKTGSSNFPADIKRKYNIPAEGIPDSWMTAYTTNYTVAAWIGYDDPKEYLGKDSQRIPKYMVKNLMEHVHKGVKIEDFKQPKNVVKLGILKGSNPAVKASDFTPKDQIAYEYFLKGNEPTKVTKQYDKISAPVGVNANYDAASNSINLHWNYPQSDSSKTPEFEVKVSIDGGASQVLARSSTMGLTIQQPNPGSTYSFTVTAIINGQKSNPASASVQITALHEEPIVPDPDLNNPDGTGDTGQNDQGQDNSNDNNSNDGNNNGNNNNPGNGNNSGNNNPGNGNNNGNNNPGNGNNNGNGSENSSGGNSGTTEPPQPPIDAENTVPPAEGDNP